MQRTQHQFERLLELDVQIRKGKYPNCRTHAEQWGINERTALRDVDFLRERLRAPVEYDPVEKGYYYSDQNWFLPAFNLSEGELFAILVAARALEQYRGTPVAATLKRAFEKIADLLPDRISVPPEFFSLRFSFTGPPAKPVDADIWLAVVRGLLRQQSIQITYRAMQSSRDKDRLIDPYHIANLQGEWYVFAFDHRAKAISQFAIPRIKKAKVTGKHFDLPDDFDPGKFLSTTFARFALGDKVEQVKLRFDKEVAPWVLEREWHPKQKVKTLADGRIELTFPATRAGMFEVMRWVLSWGRYVEVTDPLELVNVVAEEINAMSKRTLKGGQ